MPNIIMADKSVGGFAIDDFADGLAIPEDVVLTTASKLREYAFYKTAIKTLRSTSVTTAGSYCASNASALLSIFLPNATVISQNAFTENSAIKTLVLGSSGGAAWLSRYCGNLEAVDFSGGGIGNQALMGNSKMNTMILRGSTVHPLNPSALQTNTPFASGGSGGTIYIPKSLYDHLGDGTSLDYKATSGWSTIDGYGTVTWAQIEGSIYETQYADGTPIPSA